MDEFEELVIPKIYIYLFIAIREVDHEKFVDSWHEVRINEEREDYRKVLDFHSVRSLVFGIKFAV